MGAVPKRIEKEIQKLSQEPRMNNFVFYPSFPVAPGISAVPDPENLRYFHVTMEGPSGTPYEGIVHVYLYDYHPPRRTIFA